jgi:transposase-like protein
MVKSRRAFTLEFKLAAVKELESGKPLGYVARQLEVNPNVLHRWRCELERKIGQMTMENDF